MGAMRRTRLLLLALLVTSSLLCLGCATGLPNREQLETWKTNVDKTLAAAAIAADKATEIAKAATAKAEELREKQASIIADVEAVSGPLDANGDGDVTIAEAKAAYANLNKTEGGRNLLTNWETYAAVLASVAGIGVAKKGGAVAVKTLHKTGRKLVGPSQPS